MSREELLQWKQEARERIDQLAKYDATLRTVEGRLGQMRYAINSSITHMADERQEFRALEQQLRETKRAFKQDFPDVPATLGGIEKAIRHYKGIAASIDRQLQQEEHLDHEREAPTTTTTQGWNELVREASKNQESEPPVAQHGAQKRALRDLYTPDAEEQPSQPPEEQEHEPQR